MPVVELPEELPLTATPESPRSASVESASHMAGLGALVGAAALLSACGGGTGDETAGGPAQAVLQAPDYPYLVAESDSEAARFLQQAQFASTTQAMANVRAAGYVAWLNRQFAQPVGPTSWDWLESQGYGVVDSNRYYSSISPADYAVWNQLLNGEDPMRRRMALALSEFFVVSMTSANFNWRSHAMAHWWDTLVRHAFGNFRDLLKAVSLHPAMGWFLNTKGNQKENPARGRVPDENYAREVMQLFTIGLYKLNPDGSVQSGGDGAPLESYTQDDVSNLARVFTGYDFDKSDGVRLSVPDSTSTIETKDFARKPMLLDPARHSTLACNFLGTSIPENTPGEQALDIAVDTLFRHPNVGPFFARQMIQRLVTSDPSPAYVARVAARFDDNGQGVRGDLRHVWAAILLDAEARGPQGLSDTRWGKLREPMLRFIQWGQSFGARSAAGTWKLGDLSNPATRLGQSPLRAPSVFNFFRPGYIPPATAMADAQATAPEFQLVNESSVGGYLNFMQTAVRSGLLSGDLLAAYSQELALVTDAQALLRHVALVLAAGQISEANHAVMLAALEATPLTATSSDSARLNRVAAAVFMTLACADYLVQK